MPVMEQGVVIHGTQDQYLNLVSPMGVPVCAAGSVNGTGSQVSNGQLLPHWSVSGS